ncbi:MAG: hypothetical protein Q8R18_02305 [bacterium]|nr:hypothetical protein [bacterium]
MALTLEEIETIVEQYSKKYVFAQKSGASLYPFIHGCGDAQLSEIIKIDPNFSLRE